MTLVRPSRLQFGESSVSAWSRVTVARKRRGLTKKELAKRIGVTPHTVLRYESGEIAEPSSTVVDKLVAVLGFPRGFFEGDDLEEPTMQSASFRSLTTMPARTRDSALAAGVLAFLFSDWVDERFELPEPALIDLGGEEPESAAQSLRQEWQIGERPIRDVVRLLESKGVRMFSLAEQTRTLDAFSVWRNTTQPFVFLNTMKSAERGRLDACHELAHLVLHRHGGPRGREAEREADRFASSFLMPASDVLAILPRARSLNEIVMHKRRWGVSVMALIYRLHQLDCISPWQYRTFCLQATGFGYRDNEPYPIPRELSSLWPMVLTELWNERIRREDIASALHIPAAELENLVGGLATLPRPVTPRAPHDPLLSVVS